MRLWHKDMLTVLPREQLVSQWRECSAIATGIITNGTPNHILVNKIMDYDLDHFISYTNQLRDVMTTRGYSTMNSVWNKVVSVKENWEEIPFCNIYFDWMDKEYLAICYYNLLEKYRCGGIREEDWNNIENLYNALK